MTSDGNNFLRLPLFHLKSVMLDHLIAKNPAAHEVNSYYTIAISYYTFCVGKHTILGPASQALKRLTCFVMLLQRKLLFQVFDPEHQLRHCVSQFSGIHWRSRRWSLVMSSRNMSRDLDSRRFLAMRPMPGMAISSTRCVCHHFQGYFATEIGAARQVFKKTSCNNCSWENWRWPFFDNNAFYIAILLLLFLLYIFIRTSAEEQNNT